MRVYYKINDLWAYWAHLILFGAPPKKTTIDRTSGSVGNNQSSKIKSNKPKCDFCIRDNLQCRGSVKHLKIPGY